MGGGSAPEPTVVTDDGRAIWSVHGVRYDMEKYVSEHPGGEIAIRLAQGIDGTSLFQAYHPTGSNAFRVLDKYRLDQDGTLAAPTSAKPAMPATSAFKHDLDEMVRRHFAGKGKWAHKASVSHKLLMASFLAAQLCCWVGWSRGSWLATFLLPVFFWLLAVNTSHDASHFAFSSRPWLNELATYTACPMLYEPITWYYQHVIAHHSHCNDVDADVDLQHFVPLRVHPGDSKPHPSGNSTPFDYLKIFLVGLHLTFGVPLFAGIEAAHARYTKNFRPAIWEPIGLKATPKYRRRSLIGPALSVSVLLLSLFLHGIGGGLLRFAIPYAGVSLLFILCTQARAAPLCPVTSMPPPRLGMGAPTTTLPTLPTLTTAPLPTIFSPQVSHIQPEVQQAELLANPDFFKVQATTSCDYSTSSKLCSVLTGGLNTQALHHSLPNVSCCHYTDLYPEFAAICAKHGVVLSTRRSILHAASTSARHVWKLNRGWGPPPLNVAAGA